MGLFLFIVNSLEFVATFCYYVITVDMASIENLVLKFLSRPESLKYHQIERVLLHLGFFKIYAKGSHVKFKHQLLEKDLIIPVHNNDCKNFYKKLACKIIKNCIL